MPAGNLPDRDPINRLAIPHRHARLNVGVRLAVFRRVFTVRPVIFENSPMVNTRYSYPAGPAAAAFRHTHDDRVGPPGRGESKRCIEFIGEGDFEEIDQGEM